MATYMGYHNSSRTFNDKRDIPEPLTPVDRGLELLARDTFSDFQESRHIPVTELGTSDFPLVIFYGKSITEDHKVSLRIKTAQNRTFYTGPYLPVFQAVKFAHKLQALFSRNHYGCDITKEIVDD